MNILNDVNMGRTVDPITSEVGQDEVNNVLLVEHDRRELIESIHYRLSQPYLSFLLQSTNKNDIKYWNVILDEIAKVYSLNIVKIYADGILSTNNISIESIKFLAYLKVRLIYHVENKKIEKTISKEDLLIFLENDKAPEIMTTCIKYIDQESYMKFIDRIFLEVKMNFFE